MEDRWDRDRLLETSGEFMKARILLTAAELNLFTRLKEGARTLERLCADEGWDPRGLRILLDALSAMGLVTRADDGSYTIDRCTEELVADSGKESILPMILHRVRMWRTWSNLTEIVRTGDNPNLVGVNTRPIEDLQAFIGAMHVIGRTLAKSIADSLDLSGFKRMLDVGGGSGIYIAAFLRKAPHLTATLFDLPRVTDLSREWLLQSGVLDRVNVMAGDYQKDPLPGGHDLLLLSAIIHSNDREQNQRLFQRCQEALDPGGTLLVRDYVMDDHRTFPPEGAIFAVNMLVATGGGDTYTLKEIESDLELAGFRSIKLIRDNRNMDQVISAVK